MTRVSFLAPAGVGGAPLPAGVRARAVAGPIEGDFDTVARGYIANLFAATPNESLTRAAARFTAEAEAPAAAGATPAQQPHVQLKGLQEQPLTDTVVVKYQQIVRGIPVYGADLAVEMTPAKEFVSLSGQISMPSNVNPVARLSPDDARKVAKQIAGVEDFAPMGESDAPHLVYRFDTPNRRWRLAYVFDKVRIKEDRPEPGADPGAPAPEGDWEQHFAYYKLFIDAQSGEEIQRVAVRHLIVCTGHDAGGTARSFEGEQVGAVFLLIDAGRNIVTKSLGFQDINCGPKALPGDDVSSASASFADPGAVAAHFNATQVYDYYKSVFRRNSIDGQGMAIISTVHCLDYKFHYGLGICRRNVQPPPGNVWRNAAWVGTQMVYGQAPWVDGSLRCYSEALDVVGHELTHGVTDVTANLEYLTESGALNESYSDIIGIAIANQGRPIAAWDWELGTLVNGGKPLRRIDKPSDPTLDQPQPAHMSSFRRLPTGVRPSDANDQGFVHHNSGIHNKAAHNLFTDGAIAPDDVARLFYLTLTVRLGQTSTFEDSRQGMLDSCEVLFRGDASLPAKLAAVRNAFDAVGI